MINLSVLKGLLGIAGSIAGSSIAGSDPINLKSKGLESIA